jgi:hypothetical protein
MLSIKPKLWFDAQQHVMAESLLGKDDSDLLGFKESTSQYWK